MMIHRLNTCITLIISALLVVSQTNATTNCISTEPALQDAINAVSQNDNDDKSSGTSEILLCPTSVIQLSKPILIHERSVRIGCATPSDTSDKNILENIPLMCTIRGLDETQLFQIVGGVNENGHVAHTVQFHNLRLEHGESYYYWDDGNTKSNNNNPSSGGAAISSQGANLVVEDCHFDNNVATEEGGALSVTDQGHAILFLVTRTVFTENLSIQDDCHSIYFHQDHPASLAEINTEIDFVDTTTSTSSNRQLLLQHWDDPAKAAQALSQYQPHHGATLCF